MLPIASVGLLVVYLVLFTFRSSIASFETIQLWLTRASVTLLLIYLGYQVLWQKLKPFLLELSSPLNLAVCRLIYFSWQAIALVFFQRSLATEFIGKYGSYDASMRIPVEGMEWLSMHLPISQSIFAVVLPLYSISLVFSFLGLFTRISTKVHFATLLYVCFLPLLYGKVTHLHHMVWFPGLLAFSNCGHSLSLDRLIGQYIFKKKYDDTARTEFGLPIKVGMLLLGLIYFFPGFWKLWAGGFDWIFTLNITRQMYVKWGEMNGWLPFFRLDAYPALALLAAIVTVAFEFGFIFLCFYKRWRPWLMLVGILMHTGIYLFMNIPFFTLLPMYALLIDWGKLLNKSGVVEEPTSTFPKLYSLYAFAGILFVGNIYAGFTRLSSYPFACYPTFDYMVPNEMDYVHYVGYAHGKQATPYTEMKKQICRFIPDYTLRALEYKLLDAHRTNDSAQVLKLSNNILTKQNDIAGVDSIVIYKAHGGISPEGAEAAVIVEPIYSIGYK